MMAHSTTKKKNYEVEQKFILPNNNEGIDEITKKLQNQFQMTIKRETTMVDWYFDTEPPILSTNHDVWLRYRSLSLSSDGQWEVKIGGGKNNNNTSSSTVYEEVEGDEAVTECLKILLSQTDQVLLSLSVSSTTDSSSSSFEGYNIPKFPTSIPEEYEEYLQYLVPFSRIETQRSSWGSSHNNHSESLSVDLDVSNFGYSIGEVECLVHTQEDIPRAQQKITTFLQELLPSSKSKKKKKQKPLSKLEHYLMKFRPDHLQSIRPDLDISKLREELS